ncbi:hypothetical protein NIES4073_50130 [Kalymmatonema gypsitolerans NIES-4073]|nr:hypothetical protein NIES4073_50130 [Scytonema sp. NIES-4073]
MSYEKPQRVYVRQMNSLLYKALVAILSESRRGRVTLQGLNLYLLSLAYGKDAAFKPSGNEQITKLDYPDVISLTLPQLAMIP